MTFLPLLLLSAAARAASVSVFVPVEAGCEWRLVSLPSADERVVTKFERCPEQFSWAGRAVVAGDVDEVWFGDWKSGSLTKLAPPPPLPLRGRLERLGMDKKGRPLALVSDPDALYAYTDGAWTKQDGKADWYGTTLAERLARMAPNPARPRLVPVKGDIFAVGPKTRLFLMPGLAAAPLDPTVLNESGSGNYYAALPVVSPTQWIVARVEPTLTRYILPVWLVDIDNARYLSILDDQVRGQPGIAIDVRDGFILTSDRAGSVWPRIFQGSPRWTDALYENAQARDAMFFP